MHNWWIAALEHYGLFSREEAQHISNEIKLGLHRENYVEAYRELEAILSDKKVKFSAVLKELEERIGELENKVVAKDKKA